MGYAHGKVPRGMHVGNEKRSMKLGLDMNSLAERGETVPMGTGR